jgi:hypothetical protein
LGCPGGQTLRASGLTDRSRPRAHRGGGADAPPTARPPRRRFVRRRVRGAHAVLLPLVRDAGLDGKQRRGVDPDHRLGPEPNRAGDRVRRFASSATRP